MNDRKLFKETFSPMHVSEETISEVIEMTQNNNTKKIIRLPRAVASLAACFALVLGLAVTANAATRGELFEGLTGAVMDFFRINDYKGVLVDDNGEKYTMWGTDVNLLDRDGRAILMVGGDEEDITDALDQDRAYTFERTSGGTTCRVEVTGTLEDWTLKMSVFDEGGQPGPVITRTPEGTSVTFEGEEGGMVMVTDGDADDMKEKCEQFAEDNPLISSSTFSFVTPED